MSHVNGKPVRIIACEVFRPALEYLGMEGRYPHLRLTYLPSNLHLRPQELKERLLKEIAATREKGERAICLYGRCFPDIDEVCRQHGVFRAPGHYCYEMLLGSEPFHKFLSEMAGTYFAERDLILNFEEYCVRPLELHDDEMRRYCFENYCRLLYVRQPSDRNLETKAVEVADFLELSLDIGDADYSQLERELVRLIECGEDERAKGPGAQA